MDIFGIKALKEQNRQLIGTIKALQNSNLSDAISSIRTMIFPNWQSIKEIDAYIIFDDVYTVVSRWATLCASIPLIAYNDDTDEDLPKTDNFSRYLKTLTFEEKEILFTFLGLTGECFMWKDALT